MYLNVFSILHWGIAYILLLISGNGSPVKTTLMPSKTIVTNATLTADGILKYYKESGLEPVAKEVRISSVLSLQCSASTPTTTQQKQSPLGL
jgi:hypothetical protein